MNKSDSCHSLCRCTCGDLYETHVFIGTEAQFEPEKHDVDCTHYKAAIAAAIKAAEVPREER